jgi:hypothetical protein
VVDSEGEVLSAVDGGAVVSREHTVVLPAFSMWGHYSLARVWAAQAAVCLWGCVEGQGFKSSGPRPHQALMYSCTAPHPLLAVYPGLTGM